MTLNLRPPEIFTKRLSFKVVAVCIQPAQQEGPLCWQEGLDTSRTRLESSSFNATGTPEYSELQGLFSSEKQQWKSVGKHRHSLSPSRVWQEAVKESEARVKKMPKGQQAAYVNKKTKKVFLEKQCALKKYKWKLKLLHVPDFPTIIQLFHNGTLQQ